jgi:predicted phage gp36 major capsid-like protein
MFTFDTVIDSVAAAKKQFVNTMFAKNENIANSLNEFVDAQTAYTKDAVKAGTDVATKVGQEMVKITQEAIKYDYTKHVTQAVESWTKQFTPAKTK